jgi:hypothetical protein
VQIIDHIGDSSAQELLAEVLLMTKTNWNSARFAEKLPVTVRFADEVGTILRDLPDDYTPEARYAFYMRGVPSQPIASTARCELRTARPTCRFSEGLSLPTPPGEY